MPPARRAAILAAALSLCAGVAAAQNHRLMGESPADVGCAPRVRVTLDSNLPVAPISGLDRLYPPRAGRMELQGRARVRCQVSGGRASACSIVEETPAGMGFGPVAADLGARLSFPGATSPTVARLTVTYQVLVGGGCVIG